jgi:hypothetical protein
MRKADAREGGWNMTDRAQQRAIVLKNNHIIKLDAECGILGIQKEDTIQKFKFSGGADLAREESALASTGVCVKHVRKCVLPFEWTALALHFDRVQAIVSVAKLRCQAVCTKKNNEPECIQ